MVAGGFGTNKLIYTYDGINWLASENGNAIINVTTNAVVWNGSIWLAAAAGANILAYSSDGINWTGLGSAGGVLTGGCVALAWNGSIWVAGGAGTNSLAYSSNGITWTGLGNSIFTQCNTVAWNGTMWVAGGSGTNKVAYSYDGINWLGSSSGSNIISDNCNTVAWNGSRWVAGGQGTSTLAYSDNGINWSASTANEIFDPQCFAVAWNGTRWVAAGIIWNASLAYSDNGIDWTGAESSSAIITGAGRSVAWNGSLWVAGGDDDNGTAQTAYSYDGDNWFSSSASALITTIVYSAASRRPLPYVGTQVRTIPSGGDTGQVLSKRSGASYDLTWTTAGGGGPVGATGQFTFNSGSGSTGSAALSYSPTGPTGTSATGPTITVGAHLVPSAHQTYDIGATGLAFRDIYLKGSTIHLGSQKISTDGTGIFFNNSSLLNFKMYTYALDGASPITITPPSNCIAARITMSGGGGGGGNDDLGTGGGGAAGACSIHMVPFIGATACTLTLGVGGGYVDEEGGGGGGGGGETTYSFVINSITYEITCGGGGGGSSGLDGGDGAPGSGNGAGDGGGAMTIATRGSTITPFGGYLDYNPLAAGDGGVNASGTPGMINPLGGYGGAGAGAGGTAGAGGFAIFEWIYR
jgi:hypothetical protein